MNIKYLEISRIVREWSTKNFSGLIFFNVVLMFLLLLRSAGYFRPYYGITINTIVIVSIVLAVLMLGARSRSVFILTLIFWMFAAFFKTLGIDIWSERMGIYTFEALFIATVLLFFENTTIFIKKKN